MTNHHSRRGSCYAKNRSDPQSAETNIGLLQLPCHERISRPNGVTQLLLNAETNFGCRQKRQQHYGRIHHPNGPLGHSPREWDKLHMDERKNCALTHHSCREIGPNEAMYWFQNAGRTHGCQSTQQPSCAGRPTPVTNHHSRSGSCYAKNRSYPQSP